MKALGIIGFGSFGQFIVPHLKPFFDITVHNRSDRSDEAREYGVAYGSIDQVAKKDIVILCVPVQFLEETLIKIKDKVQPGAMIVDVSSVKVKPVDLMHKYLPSNVEIVGTHPLFGPQSGKDGIEGLNIVICPVKTRLARNLFRFFSQELKLNVLERTPEIHDRQMAYVQALTHFIGRSINEMDIPDVEQKTPAYQYLLDIKRNLGKDSLDLFLTIEEQNPFAKEIRESFIHELKVLHDSIQDYEE